MAGLAVADAFTVESFLDGVHHSYVVSVDEGKPTILHLGDFATQEPNGLKLSVQVDVQKVQTYQTTAETVYMYFTHKPTTNIDINMDLVTIGPSTDDWFMTQESGCYGYSNNYVVMAQVAYLVPNNAAINTQSLHGMVFTANTGDVTFNPGRETLSLDTRTINKLNDMFKSAAEEAVTITQLSMALCSNDEELFKCYQTATKSLPHTLGKKIQFLNLASTQFQALVAPKEYSLPLTTSCEFDTHVEHSLTVVYKQKHHKNFKSVAHMNISTERLFIDDHVIVDVKTGFLKRLQALYDNIPVFLWKCTSTREIEKSVEHAKQYLTAMGLTYKLASDILPNKSTVTKINIPREGIYASRVTGTNIPRSSELDTSILTTNTYLYLKLSNTTPVLKSTSLTFLNYWSLYKALARIETMPVVYGVAKKYQAHVDKLDNWVDFETYIEERTKETTFLVASEHPNFTQVGFINSHSAPSYPKPIQRHYENVIGYCKHQQAVNYVSTGVEELLKSTGAILHQYVPPHQLKLSTLKQKYPLTTRLLFDVQSPCTTYNSLTAVQIQNIAELEEFHAIHSDQE